jgi:hypothetical protein
VQKFVAILLIFSFLFGDASHVNALFLNGMVSHFRLHKKSDPQLSVLSFLKMHYLDKHGNLSQNKDHARLPFKTGQRGQNALSQLNYIIAEFPQVLPTIFHDRVPDVNLASVQSLQKGFLLSNFHPPSRA